MAKAHGVENDQLKLQGFAVPKQCAQGMVVKVNACKKTWMCFNATFCSCKMTSFKSELNSAISASFIESAKNVVLYLSPEEMSHYGTNCRQISAKMGILFELNNTTYYFKKHC